MLCGRSKKELEKIIDRYVVGWEFGKNPDLLDPSRESHKFEKRVIRKDIEYTVKRRKYPSYSDSGIAIIVLTILGKYSSLVEVVHQMRPELDVDIFNLPFSDEVREKAYGLIFMQDRLPGTFYGFRNPYKNLELLRTANLGTPVVLLSERHTEEFAQHIGYIATIGFNDININTQKLKGLLDRFVPQKI